MKDNLGCGCACSYNTSVFLSDDGNVYTCGSSRYGNTETDPKIPTQLSNLPTITQIACGGESLLCLDENGKIWSLGSNSYSQIGFSGNSTKITQPKMIEDIPIMSKIACGVYHSLSITEDGTLWSFGSNNYGELCLETKGSAKIPTQTKFTEVLAISAGWGFSIFLQEDGYIYGCGKNESYQLCVKPSSIQLNPVKIPIPDVTTRSITFCSGCDHTLFLDVDEGIVFAIGDNRYGQTCLSSDMINPSVSILSDLPRITSISTGAWHSNCLDEFGTLWVFGYNSSGQLGTSNNSHQYSPVKYPVSTPIINFSRGFGKHIIVKCENDEIWLSGCADYGQLGIIEGKGTNIPTIPDPSSINSTVFGTHYKYSNAKSARK